MFTGKFGSLVLRFAIVSGIAISLTQCTKTGIVTPHLSSNPFPCDLNVQRNVHVKTQFDAPGVNTEFVVLCQNDTITWDTDPSTHADHFAVSFDSGTPLKDGAGKDKSTFSDNSNDSSGKAGDAGLTDTQTYAYYKYKIKVKNDADHSEHSYDPGVIIVK